MGNHKTSGGSPAPRGISPLAWFSRNRPHCLRRITSLEPTALVRFRLKAKNSLVSSLLLFPQSLTTLREPFTMLQRSDLRLDGSIIIAAAGHGRTGSHPVLAACCFSLLAGKNKPKTFLFFFGGVSLLFPSRSLRSRYLGFGFRQSSGNVSVNGYAVFKVPGGHKKNLSPYLPLGERFYNR